MKFDALPLDSPGFWAGVFVVVYLIRPLFVAAMARFLKREIEDPAATAKAQSAEHDRRIKELEIWRQTAMHQLETITQSVTDLKRDNHDQTKETRRTSDSQLRTETLLDAMAKELGRQSEVQTEILRRLPPARMQ